MLKAFVGGALVGARYGATPPRVLALHGWGRSHLDFEPLLAGQRPPGSALDAVAIDLPGFGASPAPPDAWGSAEYAASLLPLLEEFANPVVVLGHSFGGRVALHLAVLAPDSVRGLVLTGVPQLGGVAPHPSPKLSYRVVRTLARRGLLSPARLEAARRRHGSSDYRAASGVLREVLVRLVGEHYETLLEQLSMPVELVWGELDTAAPLVGARRALELLPAGRLTVLEGRGHFVPSEDPAALRAALERLGC